MVTLPRPGDAAVDIWRVWLDRCTDAEVSDYRRILAPDERERADRFVFERDQRRFVVAHAALRQVLAAYLEIAPEHVEFDYGVRGKPGLRERPGSAWLRFNVAHAEELALVGVANGHDLGIDIEYARPMPEALSIAERFFTLPEQAAVSSAEGRSATAPVLHLLDPQRSGAEGHRRWSEPTAGSGRRRVDGFEVTASRRGPGPGGQTAQAAGPGPRGRSRVRSGPGDRRARSAERTHAHVARRPRIAVTAPVASSW